MKVSEAESGSLVETKTATVEPIDLDAELRFTNTQLTRTTELIIQEIIFRSRILTEFFIEPPTPAWFEDRAHYIPLRLTEQGIVCFRIVRD